MRNRLDRSSFLVCAIGLIVGAAIGPILPKPVRPSRPRPVLRRVDIAQPGATVYLPAPSESQVPGVRDDTPGLIAPHSSDFARPLVVSIGENELSHVVIRTGRLASLDAPAPTRSEQVTLTPGRLIPSAVAVASHPSQPAANSEKLYPPTASTWTCPRGYQPEWGKAFPPLHDPKPVPTLMGPLFVPKPVPPLVLAPFPPYFEGSGFYAGGVHDSLQPYPSRSYGASESSSIGGVTEFAASQQAFQNAQVRFLEAKLAAEAAARIGTSPVSFSTRPDSPQPRQQKPQPSLAIFVFPGRQEVQRVEIRTGGP